MRVLHVLAHSSREPKDAFLGSTKDARGHSEYFQSRGFEVDELVPRRRDDDELLAELRKIQAGRYDVIFFELSWHPKSIAYARRAFAGALVIFRPINAEAPHRFDIYAASIDRASAARAVASAWQNLPKLFEAWKRFQMDRACTRGAHRTLGITEWETASYWNRIGDPKKNATLPYFLPDEYVSKSAPPRAKKKRLVCLTSTGMNAFQPHLVKRFSELSAHASGEWEFFVTGDMQNLAAGNSRRLQFTGFLENPIDFLSECAAIAILSEYGRGIKTKIFEATQAKCRTLVTQTLFKRLPAEVLPYCVAVDVQSQASVEAALARCLEPYPDGDPNVVLKTRAYKVLDEMFSRIPEGACR